MFDVTSPPSNMLPFINGLQLAFAGWWFTLGAGAESNRLPFRTEPGPDILPPNANLPYMQLTIPGVGTASGGAVAGYSAALRCTVAQVLQELKLRYRSQERKTILSGSYLQNCGVGVYVEMASRYLY